MVKNRITQPTSSTAEAGDGDCQNDASDKVRRIDVMNMLREQHTYFMDQNETPFCALWNNGVNVVPTESKEYKRFLTTFLMETYKDFFPSKSMIEDLVNASSAIAISSGVQKNLNVRLYRVNDRNGNVSTVYYDLKGAVVRIDANGWKILEPDETPILFFHTNAEKPQVFPKQGGRLRELLKLVNIKPEDEVLLMTYLISGFFNDTPRPLFIANGPAGSAKTTLLQIIGRIISPSSNECMNLGNVKDTIEFGRILYRTPVVIYDNLTYLPQKTQELLCTACTGFSIDKREHYDNNNSIVYDDIKRPVLLSALNLSLNIDLADRTLRTELYRIKDEDRRQEAEIWAEFNEMLPYLLGAAFDAIQGVIRIYADTKPPKTGRMADYYRLAYCAAEVLGYGGQAFVKAADRQEKERIDRAIEFNPMITASQFLVKVHGGRFEGTAQDFLNLKMPDGYMPSLEEREKILSITTNPNWPKAPSWVGRRWNEIAGILLALGISLELPRQRWVCLTDLNWGKHIINNLEKNDES